MTKDGTVACWGQNDTLQLGASSAKAQESTPLEITLAVLGVTALSLGDRHTCALTKDSEVKCWGLNNVGQYGSSPYIPGVVSPSFTDVAAVAAGAGYTCVLTKTGAVKCVGLNASGQLGDGTTANRTTPVDVVGLSDVLHVVAGGAHSCAILREGSVKCWGDNRIGQLGDGTTTNRATPVQVVDLP